MKKINDLKLYALYDRKSGQYGQPIVQTNHDTAKRYFLYIMAKPESEIYKFDMELSYIGDYDPSAGVITPLDKPEYICDFTTGGEE